MFAILDHEPEVQVNDKTRLNAYKSFNAKDVNEISSLTIKPELTGSAIDCFSSNINERYLDWVYTTTSIDVGTENDDLIFNEGNSDVTTTLTSGTYTLQQYATHLAARMTLSGTQTYTGSVSNNKITVSAAASFSFKACSSVTQSNLAVGVTSTSHESDTVEYGIKIITLVVSNGTNTDTKYFYIKVYSFDGDKLFSQDGDLITHEPDILNWVPEGRASFKNVARRSQGLIIAWLDERGYSNVYGDKYSKKDFLDINEVKQWSTFMTLRLIFQGMSNAIDDVFDRKSKQYQVHEEAARLRASLRLDTNNDGILSEGEGTGLISVGVLRR